MAGLQFVGLMGKGGGGGGSAEINITAGATLPATAQDRQIFVVTAGAVGAFYVSTNQPTTPAIGDIWIRLAEGQQIFSFSDASPYFTIGLFQAMRYDGSLWQFRAGYLGVGSAWRQFAWPLPALGTPLEHWTCSEISIASQFGLAPMYFQVGDTKSMLSDGTTYQIEIVGFNHDDLAVGSGKAGITFGMKSCFTTTQRMNATDTSTGGWNESSFYKTTLPTLKNSIPSDLRAVVRPVKKLTSAGGPGNTISTTNDDFFLFSEIEIFGALTHSKAGEGSQYSRFATASSRVKTSGPSGPALRWWQRSPSADINTHFCNVSVAGAAEHTLASATTRGIALGFCV